MMELLMICPIWGMAGMPLKESLYKIKEAGYDGVEYGCALFDPIRNEFMQLVRELELRVVAQQYGASGNSYAAYAHNLEAHLRYLASFNPLFINSQTGRDFYSLEENLELLQLAADIERETGCRIVHETHRGKFAYSAATTIDYIERLPGLGLTGDFSHFCVVSESYLEEQQGLLERIFPHVRHLHARVGHPQGPQVTDPRLPEWKYALDVHLRWWDAVIQRSRDAGVPYFTITPEFGPVPYMPTAPFTQQPVASQWDINLYMSRLLRDRYATLL